MFRQLFKALKQGDNLDAAFDEFIQMLKSAEQMFVQANKVLRRQAEADSVREAIYKRDQSINGLLRSLRGRIIRHLTVNPGMDVAACMALMSVAKDAERIGDYCKNVFEVGRFYQDEFRIPRYHEPLERIRVEVEGLFGRVCDTFARSDADGARRIMETVETIRTRSNMIIEQLLRDQQSIEIHEAVAYSLLARHYKRVAAHLDNICTAVRGKVQDLDFRP